jgi:hypothetical protein
MKPTVPKRARQWGKASALGLSLLTISVAPQVKPTMVGAPSFHRRTNQDNPYGPPETSRKSFTNATLMK